MENKLIFRINWRNSALRVKIGATDIETRVPIQAVDGSERKYEFSFLSRNKKVVLSYCHDRANLSEEKFEILEGNRLGIHIICVVDAGNIGGNGQYPEGLMKIQKRQGYCLALDVKDAFYNKASMSVIIFARDADGFWREIKIAEGKLDAFSIDRDGSVWFENKPLLSLAEAESRRVEWQKKQAEIERERQQRQEEERKRREKDEAERQAEVKRREEDFRRNMEENFIQQERQIRDAEGNRWIKCEYCGLIAKEDKFASYGGARHVNLGICKKCSAENKVKNPLATRLDGNGKDTIKRKYDETVCPECGGKLVEKSGRYGRFIGCSNYPRCRFTRKIR